MIRATESKFSNPRRDIGRGKKWFPFSEVIARIMLAPL